MRTIGPLAIHSSFITDFGRNRAKEISVASLKVLARPVRELRHEMLEHPPATHLERQSGVINGYLLRKNEAQMHEETRSRAAEFYFNGSCLVRAVLSRRFRKIPFFLRHLWCALAD